MSKKPKLTMLVALPLLLGGWWLFRPERLFYDLAVMEKVPTNAKVVASGRFTSDAHETVGLAQILESNGRWFVRLTDFKTSNGPQVKIWLIEGLDASTTEIVKVSKHIDLGAMKGNLGNQNYEIPPGVDLTKVGAVSVWCERFSVNFGGASLKKL